MFEVIFLVHPRSSQWDSYLSIAKSLKPELESIRGFKDNVRYKCLTRPGWLLSLSDWEDEKALVRWRTRTKHHFAQEKGRERVFHDYHLRIGEVFSDNLLNGNGEASEPNQIRFDETEVGASKAITLVNFKLNESEAAPLRDSAAEEVAERLKKLGFGVDNSTSGLVALDVFEAILTPGSFLLLSAWKDRDSATSSFHGESTDRVRQVRVVRDYGMFDRREAPQYYPDVEKREEDE